MVPSILIVGLKYPRSAGILGAIFLIGRYFYTKGYKKSPKKREWGAVGAHFSTMGAIFTAIVVSVKYIL